MSDESRLDRQLIETYRGRRAPPAFAARVARMAPVPRTRILGWSAMATVTLVLAVAAYLLAPPPVPTPTDTGPKLVIPSSPDYWAEISVPLDVSVPDLSEIGPVPLFPDRPPDDTATGAGDRQSARPVPGRRTRLSSSSPFHTWESIHETAHA